MAKNQRKYDDSTVARGLVEMALCCNDAAAAHRNLKQQGIHIPQSTLKNWRSNVYVDGYHELRASDEVIRGVHERLAAGHETIAGRLLNLQYDAIDGLEKDLDKLTPGEKSQLVQRTSIATGVHTDKALVMRDKPTVIVQQQDASEMIEALKRVNGAPLPSLRR